MWPILLLFRSSSGTSPASAFHGVGLPLPLISDSLFLRGNPSIPYHWNLPSILCAISLASGRNSSCLCLLLAVDTAAAAAAAAAAWLLFSVSPRQDAGGADHHGAGHGLQSQDAPDRADGQDGVSSDADAEGC